MKQMQCNALNVKTTAKQVWLYFIRRTTRPGYAGATNNIQIVSKTKKRYLNHHLNQATRTKLLAWNGKFQTRKKSFDHPRQLKSGVWIVTMDFTYRIVPDHEQYLTSVTYWHMAIRASFSWIAPYFSSLFPN